MRLITATILIALGLMLNAACGGTTADIEQPAAPQQEVQSATSPEQDTASVYNSCDEAEAAGEVRSKGSQGSGKGFPADMVPSARDGDKDGVVCEQDAPSSASEDTKKTDNPPKKADNSVYDSCEDAEAGGETRVAGSQGGGKGFPAEMVPSARDGDKDGVVCEK